MSVRGARVKLTLMLFFIVSIGDVLSVIYQNKIAEMFFKPLLMILLIFYYLFSVSKINRWLVVGLFFSFLGDVFLLNQEKYFVFGVASFLVTHVLYIKALFSYIKVKSFIKIIALSLPFLLYFVSIMSIISSNLREMFYPVLEYGIVISVFGGVTLVLFLEEKSKANLLLLLSSISLALSDSFILLNLYHNYSKKLDFFVILLYILSQYLIVSGVIFKQLKTSQSKLIT